jgi:(p)ppGpp synthase/HD superfamily hydrolase
MATLERAIAIAVQAHQGQVDKAGAPYILHPLRVMLRLESEQARIAAVLHDVVEDSPWTIAQLAQEGFSPAVLGALQCLTKQDGEDYEAFIARVRTDSLASEVKKADLLDNMDFLRLPELRPGDLERLAKYHRAWRALEGQPGLNG